MKLLPFVILAGIVVGIMIYPTTTRSIRPSSFVFTSAVITSGAYLLALMFREFFEFVLYLLGQR